MKPRVCNPKSKTTESDKKRSVKTKQADFRNVALNNFKILPNNS